MEDLISIGCPVCGSVLKVKNQYGMESKSVTCPVCKTRSPFKDFKKILNVPKNEEPATELGLTEVSAKNLTLGKFTVVGLALSYQLTPGKHIIGRKANGSEAHFQIPCSNKRMSREHLLIEVKKLPNQGFVHYVSLYKEKVNKTYIGSTLLEYGDKIELENHCIIKLPDTDIRFDIPDDDETEI